MKKSNAQQALNALAAMPKPINEETFILKTAETIVVNSFSNVPKSYQKKISKLLVDFYFTGVKKGLKTLL